MTKAEEVLQALRADRLCTVCNFFQPDDWSIDLCHACSHMKRERRSLEDVAAKCGRCYGHLVFIEQFGGSTKAVARNAPAYIGTRILP